MTVSPAAFFFDMLERANVRIEYGGLSNPDRLGEYAHSHQLVRLVEDLAPRELPLVLGHETGHVVLDHVPSMFGHFDARMERDADEWAVSHLFTHNDYRDAEHAADGHLPTIAYFLGTVDEAIEIYQRRLLRVGDQVYFGARMGLGQWQQKFAVNS